MKSRCRPKTCLSCGHVFVPNGGRQLRCSWCRKLHRHIRVLETGRRWRARRRRSIYEDVCDLDNKDEVFRFSSVVDYVGQPGTHGTPLMNLKARGWNGQARISAALYLKRKAPQLPIAPA